MTEFSGWLRHCFRIVTFLLIYILSNIYHDCILLLNELIFLTSIPYSNQYLKAASSDKRVGGTGLWLAALALNTYLFSQYFLANLLD